MYRKCWPGSAKRAVRFGNFGVSRMTQKLILKKHDMLCDQMHLAQDRD